MALIVAVIISAFLAWLASSLLRRFLTGLDFDDRLKRWGLTGVTEWSPRESPALLATRVVAWSIVLFGFVLGLAAFDATLTSRLAFVILTYIPKMVGAALLMILGALLAR